MSKDAESSRTRTPGGVVITGLGAVTPIGVGLAAFARGLRAGRSGVRPLAFGHASMRSSVAATCADFDAEAVMDPGEVRRLPRLVPMALAAAREAVAQARLPLESLEASRRTALLLGTGGGGIDFTLDQAAAFHAGRATSLWTITNATHGNLAGELSILLGCRGPSLCVSDGCASSSDAVAHAATLLRGERPGAPDAAIVIGADAHIRPETLIGMEHLRVISTRPWPGQEARASRPFDRDRDGFVLGEGAWAVVLERELAAASRGARVLGRVLGLGQTCDAYHRVRPDPEMTECVRAIRLAMADAGLGAQDVGLVHYHGTGTKLNDAQETRAVRAAFGDHAGALVGHSVKGAIGHPQGASGLAAMVATLAGLLGADGGAPFGLPTLNLDTPDPDCDLDYTPRVARDLPAAGAVRTFLVNCLAFGAKNTALIVRAE